MHRIDYDHRQYAVYATGRSLPEQAAKLWAEVFARWAPPRRPQTALDLGSGTGRFTPILATTLGGPVYGVEPSARMREVAEQGAAAPGVTYLAGRAEQIPLPGQSCDLILMFLSFHHVTDRPAAVAEIRRVLRPGGRVLIRSTFADRMPDLLWHRWFPEAREVELRMFPRLTEVTRLFARAGLGVAGLERVRELGAPDLATYAERLRLRAISTFDHLSEEQLARGFEALDRAVEQAEVPGPITMESDLLILGE